MKNGTKKNLKVEISWLLLYFAERCEIQISNFPLSFVTREFAKLWQIHMNFVPFPVKIRRISWLFLLFSVVLHEKFLLFQILRLRVDLESKNQFVFLSHLFDVIPSDVTCWLLAPAVLLHKK